MLLALLLSANPAAFHLVSDDAPIAEQAPSLTPALRPSLFGPIFATALGGVVMAWGLYIGIVGTILSGALYWIGAGAAIGVAGVGLAAVGVVRLVSTVRERRAFDAQTVVFEF
jgi:hypothetical protein